jgi:leucyl aminopeptidase
MSLTFAKTTQTTIPLHLVRQEDVQNLTGNLTSSQVDWLTAHGFTGAAGSVCVLPAANGAGIGAVVAGLGNAQEQKRLRFTLGTVRGKLPKGVFDLQTSLKGADLDEQLLGWLLSGYVFDRYKKLSAPKADLVAPEGVDAERLEVIASGEALTRDLINTPASDMGPQELAASAQALANEFGAKYSETTGDDLIEQNFPMIHAVGRASSRAPRLVEMNWGTSGPHLTLVGKGVCFDTGGLNLKPGSSMGLMKKDMGGAATVLGLARMIMGLDLPLQLRVLIPAVENSVSSNAFRPQDVLPSRKGLSVEINNTDAEGRLVLADALALADEKETDLMISMATLTGAARVAVGPDLAPFYVTEQADAQALHSGAALVRDPVWQMPFWAPYEKMIEPAVADLDNAPAGGFAGSITAALFLKRFVTQNQRYMHFDIYGWNPAAAPARPKGGVGQGARAVLAALPELLGYE